MQAHQGSPGASQQHRFLSLSTLGWDERTPGVSPGAAQHAVNPAAIQAQNRGGQPS